MPDVRPPAAVLAAFDATDDPVLLPGGRGGTWVSGQVILKKVDFLPEALWRAELLTTLTDTAEFRVARPVRTNGGDWVAYGWEASHWVEGKSDATRLDEILRAGVAFHTAVSRVRRPAFLDFRNCVWSYGDRVAWDERPLRAGRTAQELLRPLLAHRRPVSVRSQVVHGDLTGNVLFADGLPPAIIDWPAYWRPTAWALAVAVVDALCWHGASPDLVGRWAHQAAWGQMLVRALIYRIATQEAVAKSAGWTTDVLEAYRSTIDVVVTHAEAEQRFG